MSGAPIRFLHAADLHLDQPLEGLLEAPDHMRELLIEAPLIAAERIFDTALLEEVDFVLLAGDVLDLKALQPRAATFLLNQFERLAEQKIKVYWTGGDVDRQEDWPEAIQLPSNVYTFSRHEVELFTHLRGEKPIACIIGGGGRGPSRIAAIANRAEGGDLPAIGLYHGEARSEALSQKSMCYWALGGEHQRRQVTTTQVPTFYAGSPQGRDPEETGAHGCILVELLDEAQTQTREVSTDSIRWRDEKIVVEEHTKQTDFSRLLNDRMRGLATEAGGRTLLIHWKLTGEGLLAEAFRRKGFQVDLLAKLRKEFGHRDPPVWTYGLDRQLPEKLPEDWCEEDTILGDFLRSVRDIQKTNKSLDVSPFLTGANVSEEVRRSLLTNDTQTRPAILREATALGVDLLRGDESRI